MNDVKFLDGHVCIGADEAQEFGDACVAERLGYGDEVVITYAVEPINYANADEDRYQGSPGPALNKVASSTLLCFSLRIYTKHGIVLGSSRRRRSFIR